MTRVHQQLSWLLELVLITLATLVLIGEGAKLGTYLGDNAIFENNIADLIGGLVENARHSRSEMTRDASDDQEEPLSAGPGVRTAYIQQLYQAILQESSDSGRDEREPTIRRKRPRNYGLLGLDNFDFTVSTLDRARSRNRNMDLEMARQKSKQVSTHSAPNPLRQMGGMSMSPSIGDLRSMISIMNNNKGGR